MPSDVSHSWGQGSLVAGTVPVFSGQVGLFRVVLGLMRDPAAASLPLEVSGVTQLFGSTCSRSSRSSNLPPSARRFRYLRSLSDLWTPFGLSLPETHPRSCRS